MAERDKIRELAEKIARESNWDNRALIVDGIEADLRAELPSIQADARQQIECKRIISAAMEQERRDAQRITDITHPEITRRAADLQRELARLGRIGKTTKQIELPSTPIETAIFQAYKLGCEQLAEARAQGWIECSERLPEYGTVLLVFCNEGDGLPYQSIATYSYHGGWYVGSVGTKQEGVEVTHWRELPAPPAKDTEKRQYVVGSHEPTS